MLRKQNYHALTLPDGTEIPGLIPVQALEQRINSSPIPASLAGRRVLDLERRLLLDSEGGEERLAPGEFNLLKLFVQNPNRPLARDWLLEVTSHREAEAFDRAIDLRIARLRRKIEQDSAHPEAIRTVRGVGYMFVPKAR